jgi:hypothetical protein
VSVAAIAQLPQQEQDPPLQDEQPEEDLPATGLPSEAAKKRDKALRVFLLKHFLHWIGSSASLMGRKASNREPQSRQVYS